MEPTESAPERPPSPPRPLPTAEYEVCDSDVLLEEETFSWYKPDKWYHVRIGEVFRSRYQVMLKLGFGSVSTVWLCRDPQKHRYVTLKIYETGHRQALNETKVLDHLKSIKSSHPGAKLVRLVLDSFEIAGAKGSHAVLIYESLGLSLGEIRRIAGGKLPDNVLKPMLHGILLGLDFLHSIGHVVHTDIHEENIMISVPDQAFFDALVASEFASPSARKIEGDRIVYASAALEIPDDPGEPVISDFGDARFGEGPFKGEVMPDLYRAPEIILAVPWNEKIDIWAVGMMVWDLYEGKHLFNQRLPSREQSSAAHLERMVSLLGPPPADLLERCRRVAEKLFDASGRLKNTYGASSSTLEDEEENLDGEERTEFLAFLRKMLQWKSADRASACDLIKDPWLRRTS